MIPNILLMSKVLVSEILAFEVPASDVCVESLDYFTFKAYEQILEFNSQLI